MQILNKSKNTQRLSREERTLLCDFFGAKDELDAVRCRFQYVTEPELVAACIYEMHSAQEKYNYLLTQVRTRGLSLKSRRLLEDEDQPKR